MSPSEVNEKLKSKILNIQKEYAQLDTEEGLKKDEEKKI